MKKNIFKKFFKTKSEAAFSLIELSIVIVVLSIIIAGILSSSGSKSTNEKVQTTKSRIDQVYKAMGSYVLANKRLPCPASVTSIKSSDSAYGAEGGSAGACSVTGVYASTTNSNLVYGMVPVKALGLPNEFAEDAYGSKIAYVIDKTYTSTSTFGTSNSGITIQKYVNGALTTTATDAIFVLLSYGPNKSGAINPTAATLNTASSDTDEVTNGITSLNDAAKTAVFTSTFVDYTERGSNTFDDTVFYKSRQNFLTDSKALEVLNDNTTSDANLKDCTLTTNQNFGSGSIWTGAANPNVTSGTTITLSCRSGYGKEFDADSGNSDSTCGRAATDRTNISPTATCVANTTWTVSNDCEACRGCSQGSPGDNNGTIYWSMSCNDWSTTSNSMINECEAAGRNFSVSNNGTVTLGHVRRQRCNNDCDDRNICAVGTYTCLDGRLRFDNDNSGQSLGSSDNCSGITRQCGEHSVGCNH